MTLRYESTGEWLSEGSFALTSLRARFFLESQTEKLEVKNTEQQDE